jgi:deoxycytidine triphosphate deaminase
MVQRTGNFTQERVPVSDRLKSQPLSIEAVYRQGGNAVVGDEGLLRRERSEVEPRSRREFQQRAKEDAVDLLGKVGIDPHSRERFYLVDEDDNYFVEFTESVIVPTEHVGLIQPRGTLMKSGAMLETTFVEPEQEDVMAQVFVDDGLVLLAEDATVAELVVARARG